MGIKPPCTAGEFERMLHEDVQSPFLGIRNIIVQQD
jgi:hypothetical protein